MIAFLGRLLCRHLHADNEWGRPICGKVICLKCLREHKVSWHVPGGSHRFESAVSQ